MNRKRREAAVRRAMAAGRRRPTPSERAATDLLQEELEVQQGSVDARKERTELVRPRGV